MQLRKQSKMHKEHSGDEMIQVMIPKNRLKRPFPLAWGLASLFLLVAFAAVTQLQFNRISDDKIYAVEIDSFEVEHDAWLVATRAYEDCKESIETRATYRQIFSGVEDLFKQTADLPASLFPAS